MREERIETITIHSAGGLRRIKAEKGQSLLHALRREGIRLHASCGGNRTCGKCEVKASGHLSLLTSEEAARLHGRTGLRLACYATIEGPVTVYLDRPELMDIRTDWPFPLTASTPLFDSGIGAAIDIGTTTICVYLFDQAGTILSVTSEASRQAAYGADIMTRIAFANEDPDNELHHVLVRQIDELLQEAEKEAGIEADHLQAAVITGNTTMLHFLAGLPTMSIALAPYRPESHFGCFFNLNRSTTTPLPSYLPPCISAYVGADIATGMIYAGLDEKKDGQLLIDVGTNGEIVLAANGTLFSCSTAAGPAFEGAGIEMGSGAVPGAIFKVVKQEGSMAFETIGNREAASICGSGLLDLIAVSYDLGYIDERGRIKDKDKLFIGQSDVYLTQKDIRQLQLAKGAIRAGIDTILHHAGLCPEDIKKVYVAGGFGSKLNPQAAECIGMLPPGFSKKTNALGNAAAAGASLLLLNKDLKERVEAVAAATQTIELSADRFFMDRFVHLLNFPL